MYEDEERRCRETLCDGCGRDPGPDLLSGEGAPSCGRAGQPPTRRFSGSLECRPLDLLHLPRDSEDGLYEPISELVDIFATQFYARPSLSLEVDREPEGLIGLEEEVTDRPLHLVAIYAVLA